MCVDVMQSTLESSERDEGQAITKSKSNYPQTEQEFDELGFPGQLAVTKWKDKFSSLQSNVCSSAGDLKHKLSWVIHKTTVNTAVDG